MQNKSNEKKINNTNAQKRSFCNSLFPISYFLTPKQSGFTLIELIVVTAIIGIFASIMLVNLAGLRGPRNLRISQSELVTNLRKLQSQVLSSRDINAQNSVRYYIMNINRGATNYTYSAVGVNKTTSVQSTFTTLQTINLPSGITVNDISVTLPTGSVVTAGCVQIAFGAPFAKTYIDYRLAPDTGCAFISIVNPTVNDAALQNLVNRSVSITLRDNASNTTKIVELRGVTGLIQVK